LPDRFTRAARDLLNAFAMDSRLKFAHSVAAHPADDPSAQGALRWGPSLPGLTRQSILLNDSLLLDGCAGQARA
jgi:hypothetical protein